MDLIFAAGLLAAQAPVIATQDSGVSWGALIGIVGALCTIGVAGITAFYRALAGQIEQLRQAANESRIEARQQAADTRAEIIGLVDRLESKVANVELKAREARAEQWKEHNALRERFVTVEATTRAMSMTTPGGIGGDL